MASQFICDVPEGARVESSCIVCSAMFQYRRLPGQRGRIRRFCSPSCRMDQVKRQKKSYSRRRVLAQPCAHCGEMFHAAYTKVPGHGLYCSPSCSAARLKVHKDRRTGKRLSNKRRRARLRGASIEVFADVEIFDRDAWRCGLCGLKVDKRFKHPHKMAASLDHIVPLAAGGSHTRLNVQCAHWLCNSRKTWVGGGQLRLLP